MKFKILSHACISITQDDFNLVIDPWIIGSCYWRSWWNYPEVEQSHLENINPNAVYLTHLHWDHFHGPSIRKLKKQNPKLKVIIPKLHTIRMLEDLVDCNVPLSDIIEVEHAHSYNITKKFKIWSYQFGFDNDSALVVTDGKYRLLDMNDCKMFGYPLIKLRLNFLILTLFSVVTPMLNTCLIALKTRKYILMI